MTNVPGKPKLNLLTIVGLTVFIAAGWLLVSDFWLAPPSSIEPPPVSPTVDDPNAKWRVIVPIGGALLALAGALMIGVGVMRSRHV